MTNEIEGIKPFNDILYLRCRYNPLFTAVYYFGGNIYPFLANDIFVYTDNQFAGYPISTLHIPIKNTFEVMKDMGIFSTSIHSNDLQSSVKDSIDMGRPVYIRVDNFYRNSSATYNKGHGTHSYLIYGYDFNNSIFKVIDVDVPAKSCYKDEIDCDEIILGYKGYLDWGLDENLLIQSIYKEKDKLINVQVDSKWFSLNVFKRNMINNRDKIHSSLMKLIDASQYYKNCVDEPERIFSLSLSGINSVFFQLQIRKKVEMYRFFTFFGEKIEILNCLRDTYDNFEIVKGLLQKMVVTQKIEVNFIDRIIQKLYKIYDNELYYHNELYKITETVI